MNAHLDTDATNQETTAPHPWMLFCREKNREIQKHKHNTTRYGFFIVIWSQYGCFGCVWFLSRNHLVVVFALNLFNAKSIFSWFFAGLTIFFVFWLQLLNRVKISRASKYLSTLLFVCVCCLFVLLSAN